MTNDEIRAGVAGAGVFGGYHAAKYAELGVLSAVYDPDASRAEALSAEHGAEAFTSYADFLNAVDALTIAAPASVHAELAGRALERGRHVLVEKPVAMLLDAADLLVEMAASAGLVFQVGHQERYVAGALGLLERPDPPRRMTSRRLNRFSGRAMDVSVVMDLMIHDLDLAAKLAGTSEAVLASCKARRERGEHVDEVHATLRFESGMEAKLSASRLSEKPIRDLALDYTDGRIHLDFLTREVTNDTPARLVGLADPEAPLALRDPLAYGARSFLDAVRGGGVAEVTGRDGRDALALALMIERAAKEGVA